MHSFQVKVALRGYHVYKNIVWTAVQVGDRITVELETNPQSKDIDPYFCAIKALVGLTQSKETVGHIPREISRHTFFSEKRRRDD